MKELIAECDGLVEDMKVREYSMMKIVMRMMMMMFLLMILIMIMMMIR